MVGHRGAGGNGPSRGHAGRMHRENTVASFAAAAAAGADAVELDVQLTADGVPVVWHDDFVYYRERAKAGAGDRDFSRAAVSDFTLAQWRERVGGDAAAGRPSAQLGRPFSHGAAAEPWDALVEGHLPTLEEALAAVDPTTGLLWDLELKFCEARSDARRGEGLEGEEAWAAYTRLAAEATHAVAARSGHAVMYSSFDPDACMAARAVAPDEVAVLMLTDASHCPAGGHADARRCSLAAATAFVDAHGLDGMVAEVLALQKDPSFCKWGSEARGRWLLTYGNANNVRVMPTQRAALAKTSLCFCADDLFPIAVP